MARKRLRPFLDEVISDADLRSSAEHVGAGPTPVAPSPAAPAGPIDSSAADTPSEPVTGAFPPPPWEAPPELAAAVSGEATPVSIASGAVAPAIVEPAPAAALVVSPPVAEAEAPVERAPLPALQPAVSPVEVETPAAVLLGAITDAAHPGARRRRRSASLLPPLPSAADVPEDADGRVSIFSVPGPPAAAAEPAPPPADPTPPGSGPAPITTVGGDAPLAGWLPVAALGVVLVIVFVIGILVTR